MVNINASTKTESLISGTEQNPCPLLIYFLLLSFNIISLFKVKLRLEEKPMNATLSTFATKLMTSNLSFAGRLQLVIQCCSVLLCIGHRFFLTPKAVIKKINSIFRSFLLTGIQNRNYQLAKGLLSSEIWWLGC